ncbi:NAD(P)H-dependent oxidoreductase [Mycoplasma enhydrae]|uniref:NAD(P)H-dependent oxidoreductase n=1 Tax=Mycoplasma enhydrae TaxID=2499220 RepID=UPI0021E95963|nr:NAD(P)H-dependent oxidoreductase [Mycoplasma enhydrae]MCV3753295.1 NAD(P)H-dependent oxidoreductase [Mycoplasma enhydrae]
MKSTKNIYLILGHTTLDSFNGKLADEYEKKLRQLNKNVRRINLNHNDFDVCLLKDSQSEKNKQFILKEQENIKWADEIVFFYPLWWASVPAILKGYIDNVFQSGFAFKYHENDPFWDKLLTGKKVRVFSTSGAPSIFIKLLYKNADFSMFRTGVCWFTGMKLIQAKRIGSLVKMDSAKRKEVIDKIISKIR